MNPAQEYLQLRTRRYFLQQGALGLGGVALASLTSAGADSGSPAGPPLGGPHFRPTAKRVIYLT